MPFFFFCFRLRMMDITVKTLDGQNRSFSVPENVNICFISAACQLIVYDAPTKIQSTLIISIPPTCNSPLLLTSNWTLCPSFSYPIYSLYFSSTYLDLLSVWPSGYLDHDFRRNFLVFLILLNSYSGTQSQKQMNMVKMIYNTELSVEFK